MRAPDFVPSFGYEHPDLGDNPLPDPFLEADMFLTRRIAETIEQHYFGHAFDVRVSHQQGIVKIKIPQLMPRAEDWWCVHIAHLANDPGLKAIVRACGELLEVFGVPRLAYDREAFIAAIESVKALENKKKRHGLILARS
jgi:hypothetical protein